MATLDLSDALLEPDFQDILRVERRIETVNLGGISVLSTLRLQGSGVVTVSGDNSMVRADAYTKGARAIEIYTRMRLQGPAPGFQPDVIDWRGNRFVVKTVDDYSNFASGFVKVECVSMDLIEDAPRPFKPLPPFPGQFVFTDPANASWVTAL